jgi:hypothetical protein
MFLSLVTLIVFEEVTATPSISMFKAFFFFEKIPYLTLG